MIITAKGYEAGVPKKYQLLIQSISGKPALAEIMESITDDSGNIPRKYWPLINDLECAALIWRAVQNNGNVTAELSPAMKFCYKHYRRLNSGPILKRWLWLKILSIFQAEYLVELDRNIRAVEKVRQKLMP
ncbi:MAG: hypothetical protein PHF50_01210 [Patescibacteria group bacterium]|nr:hypothetical protein [Patescibacteria group bacterium]